MLKQSLRKAIVIVTILAANKSQALKIAENERKDFAAIFGAANLLDAYLCHGMLFEGYKNALNAYTLVFECVRLVESTKTLKVSPPEAA